MITSWSAVTCPISCCKRLGRNRLSDSDSNSHCHGLRGANEEESVFLQHRSASDSKLCKRIRRNRWGRYTMLHNFLVAALIWCFANIAFTQDLPLERIQLPPGFHIELLARVPNARQMVLGEHNVLFVGSMTEGKVHALKLDQNYRAGKLYVIASGLSLPIGVAYRQGSLYVSAVDRLLQFPNVENQLASPPRPVVLRDDLPKEMHHGGRAIAFGPDGFLYVAIGAPCNICEENPDRYASILRMQPDGSQSAIFARGIRNSVGFDWHPTTGELWFTDNGRDLLGDDVPPDELNYAPRTSMHFGYPYCHAGAIADPEYGKKRPCSDFTPPAQNLDAHVASLDMRFYNGSQFPIEYRHQIFVAEHGSWNRSQKVGYKSRRHGAGRRTY